MKSRRVGLWLLGASGGVATTAVLGLAAWKRGLIDGVGLVSDLPQFRHLDLDPADAFVVGGHEIRQAGFLDTAIELHQRSNVFDANILKECRPDLEAWQQNVQPGTTFGAGSTIGRLADRPEVSTKGPASGIVAKIQADIGAFQKQYQLDQVVVVNVTSTEPPFEANANFDTVAGFRKLLSETDVTIPASALYAWAALELGLPFVNFTPSLGASFPAALLLAQEKKTVTCGKDGKTGETLMKSALAPMFAQRNLKILSWVGHNIFGNRDGLVLDDPANKASKIKTKDQLIQQIVGYKPQTHVSIEYIESLDDWKTAWNHIHYRGFLNTKMILQFLWQGCDSILAAPLVLDLARFSLLAQRQGEVGVLEYLASFFKGPMGHLDHDFWRQFAMLEEHLRKK